MHRTTSNPSIPHGTIPVMSVILFFLLFWCVIAIFIFKKYSLSLGKNSCIYSLISFEEVEYVHILAFCDLLKLI